MMLKDGDTVQYARIIGFALHLLRTTAPDSTPATNPLLTPTGPFRRLILAFKWSVPTHSNILK